jgi:hypothetical protein
MSEANPISEANPSQEPAPVENEAPRASQVSEVVNPTQNSGYVEANQGSATVAAHDLFDGIPDEVMQTIPEINVDATPKQGQVKAEKGKALNKLVKLYHGQKRRESERIKVNRMKKPIKGVGSTATEPIVINEADEGVLTQEEHPKLGTYFRSMKSWKNLREN